jgi:hypothetical protein
LSSHADAQQIRVGKPFIALDNVIIQIDVFGWMVLKLEVMWTATCNEVGRLRYPLALDLMLVWLWIGEFPLIKFSPISVDRSVDNYQSFVWAWVSCAD